MRLTTREEYNASPQAVFAIIGDPAFQAAKCAATSTGKYTIDVAEHGDHTVIRSERHLPSDGLPDAARSFVGQELTVIEIQDWGPAETDGSRRCAVDLHITGAPVTLRGEALLAPSARGSVETLEGDLKANIPFIGGKIERSAAGPILGAISIEADTIRTFLDR